MLNEYDCCQSGFLVAKVVQLTLNRADLIFEIIISLWKMYACYIYMGQRSYLLIYVIDKILLILQL